MDISIEIEERIISDIRSVPARIQTSQARGDGAWTKLIFQLVADFGHSLNFDICASRKDVGYDGGWLYDLIWYKNDTSKFLHSVPLILECEWHTSYERIKYDFEKLLICKAELKIMIFQSSAHQAPELFQLLEAGISAFNSMSTDEIYLLICFNLATNEFDIKRIKIQAGSPKIISEAVLPPLPAT